MLALLLVQLLWLLLLLLLLLLAVAGCCWLFNITVVAAAHSSGLRSDALFVLVAEIVMCCIACLWGPGNAVNATSPLQG